MSQPSPQASYLFDRGQADQDRLIRSSEVLVWAMPLLLVLLPEGFLLPRDFAWTLPRAVFVTGLLAAGTAVWTAIAVGVVRGLRPSSACR